MGGNVSEIRRIDFKHAEADIGNPLWFLAKLELTIGFLYLSNNLLAGSTDTLLADLADVLVTSLRSLRLLVAGLRQLHHDEPAAATVLGVELHDGVRGRGRSGEEVEENSRVLQHLFNQESH